MGAINGIQLVASLDSSDSVFINLGVEETAPSNCVSLLLTCNLSD